MLFVPSRREQSPYQLPLNLGRRIEDTAVYRAILGSLSQATESSRLVRVVQEEVLIRAPADVGRHLVEKVFVPFDRLDQEELWLLLLSTRKRITHEVLLYRGTVDTVPVRPAEVFKEAVRVNAPSIILAHNHPSGDPAPSPQDVHLTETILEAGKMLGIELLDHIVVGQNKWVSFRELKLGFG